MNTHSAIGRLLLGTAATLLAASQAWATCPVPANCTTTYYNDVTTVPALLVASDATQNAQGLWDYRYTVTSDVTPGGSSPFVMLAMNIPYFPDANISQLHVGASVSGYQGVSIVNLPDGSASIKVATQAPPPPSLQSIVTVLEFTSSYAPTEHGTASIRLGGLQSSRTSYEMGQQVTVVTRGIAPSTPTLLTVVLPASPLAIAASVPEPGTMAMMLLGVAGLALSRRREANQANTARRTAL